MNMQINKPRYNPFTPRVNFQKTPRFPIGSLSANIPHIFRLNTQYQTIVNPNSSNAVETAYRVNNSAVSNTKSQRTNPFYKMGPLEISNQIAR
jgi:hypothetical protein